MKWKIPPKIKVYEALGCLGDNRIKVEDNVVKVYSSSRNKFYVVEYDSRKNAIMANDNGSYWVGYLGYPSIAFLMQRGIIDYDPQYSNALKDIKWKDINTKFKNNFEKTEQHILKLLGERGISRDSILSEVDSIMRQLEKLDLSLLGKRTKPPTGY
jgi:hypothetical protein